MKRIRIIGIVACSPWWRRHAAGDDGEGRQPRPRPVATGDRSGRCREFGESTDADPALVEKALGPVEPSDEASWNIILASIARADQDLDQATIDKAMECWNKQECDTGTGGETRDGLRRRRRRHGERLACGEPHGGHPPGAHLRRDRDDRLHRGRFRNPDPAVARQRHQVPDPDEASTSSSAIPTWVWPSPTPIKEADDAGIPYVPFSAGWVGLPGQEGALVPGEDYLTVVGEDLCALGDSFAEVLNTGVGHRRGRDPRRDPRQRPVPRLAAVRDRGARSGIELVNPPANENSTTGDTSWYPPAIPGVYQGLLTTNPEIRGWAYEYADGMNIGLQTYEELGIPVKNLTVALRTDEQNLFCDWADRNEPDLQHLVLGRWQLPVTGRRHRGDDVAARAPRSRPEVVVPHVMREVTAADCDPESGRPRPFPAPRWCRTRSCS